MHSNYERYRALMRKVSDVENSIGVMSWDQETYMPPKGAGFRAQAKGRQAQGGAEQNR